MSWETAGISYRRTYFGHSLVRDETCGQTAQQAADLQGAHVRAAYEEERSDSQGIMG